MTYLNYLEASEENINSDVLARRVQVPSRMGLNCEMGFLIFFKFSLSFHHQSRASNESIFQQILLAPYTAWVSELIKMGVASVILFLLTKYLRIFFCWIKPLCGNLFFFLQ